MVGALLYILTALQEAKFLGRKMFFENLVCRTDESPKRPNFDRYFTEYSSIASYVSVFLHTDAHHTAAEVFLFDGARGSRVGCYYVDHFTLLSILLQVRLELRFLGSFLI